MSFTTFTRLSLSIGSLAIVLASASTARAQACKDTTQCPQGFVCEISPNPVPPTDPGDPTSGATVPADLRAPDAGGYCRPAPCTKDSECGAGMLCHSETRTECSGVTPAIACAPNSDCGKGAPVPQTCTETKVSVCAYKWQLPCSTDVECGAGFTCMPSVSGSCSGGGGTATPGTSATAPSGVARDIAAPTPIPSDPMCTTKTSFPGYCQPKATTCTVDSDCPTAWTCGGGANTGTPVTSGPAAGGGTTGADGGASIAAPPATDLPAPKPPEETTKTCQSPLGYGGTVGRDDGAVDKGDPSSTPQTPSVPPTGQPGNGTGSPEAADTSPKAGCAVGGDVSGSSFALLAVGLVGIAFARRRRR